MNRAEWADAGRGRRIVFGAAAVYWTALSVAVVIGLAQAASAEAAGRLLGLAYAPLPIAAVLRAIYVYARAGLAGPVRSWWILVIAAAWSLMAAAQRALMPIAEQAY